MISTQLEIHVTSWRTKCLSLLNSAFTTFYFCFRFLEGMKMPIGVPRTSGSTKFQISDILELNEQAKSAHTDSEAIHSKSIWGPKRTYLGRLRRWLLTATFRHSGPIQTVLPGSGHPNEYAHIAANFAAHQQAAVAAGLFSHSMANHHDSLHQHSQWARQDPSVHGEF